MIRVFLLCALVSAPLIVYAMEYTVWVSEKDGVWLTSEPGSGDRVIQKGFNAELTVLDETLSPRWLHVTGGRHDGWVSPSGVSGKRWSPVDDDIKEAADRFVEAMRSERPLAAYFTRQFNFEYHEYNRCTGSTDGKLPQIKRKAIDEGFELKVRTTGDGWACKDVGESTTSLPFLLKRKLEGWDRFEVRSFDFAEKEAVIWGRGEAQYLIAQYAEVNGDFYISGLEFRDEDPG